MKIADVIKFLEEQYPLSLQESYDNCGVQVGDVAQELTGCLLAVDISEALLEEAVEKGMNLVITHHPLLFHPLKQVTTNTYIERCVAYALRHHLVLYAIHTNLDNSPKGLNYHWAKKMNLQNIQPLRPLKEGGGGGIIGALPEPISIETLISRIKEWQPIEMVIHSQILRPEVERIAYCGGAGAFLIPDAIQHGADIFITGEAKYNDYWDAQKKITLMTLGHYESEELSKKIILDLLSELSEKKSNFAVSTALACTNPLNYVR